MIYIMQGELSKEIKEDFKESEKHLSLGTYTVTKKEIVDFAEKYDPFPFHVDEAKAKENYF
ncbi:MAG: hypothetical protein CM15mP62_01420 [Rhodospirillaceae bacterium]|nr:MAG: hypothetical protein CM15mP62_01420 [Rhodospirillaceae bacterium]